MNRPNDLHTEDWMDARVEAYLDGDLPAHERTVFERTLAENPVWEAEVLLAREVREALRTLPEPDCPSFVTDAVMARVQREARASAIEQAQGWIEQHILVLWRPALAMAVLVLLVVAGALIGRPPQPAPQYADAEVQQALDEVRWTLALLTEVGRQTGQSVKQDVLGERVVAPVQEAFTGSPSDNDMQR